MTKQITVLLILLLAVLSACNKGREFTEVKQLSEFEGTEFIPTLEHKIQPDKNAVYCASLLFAWDEVRKQIAEPLTVSKEYPDLRLLNQSNAFKGVLAHDEYSARGDVEEGLIIVKAEFSKSLPFEFKYQSFDEKLTFNGQKVASFGIEEHADKEMVKNMKIAYYRNDNNFLLKLFPKNKAHEIILLRSEKSFSSISKMVDEVARLTAIGKKEAKNSKKSWKYYFNDEDVVLIPKLNFNIETNYPTLVGSRFTSSRRNFRVAEARQRTAFILNESGAEIEAEALLAADSIAMQEYEEPSPKRLVFDKPFLILLKRVDSDNPYFGFWVANTELMEKK